MRSYIFLWAFVALPLVLAKDKLHYVLTLVSQGTITPDYPIPTKSWEDWEEKGPNELTAMGMREQYLLGHELRRRYVEDQFIDFEYVLNQVQVLMIDHNYTIMSGQAFLRGFLGDNLATLNDNQLKVAEPPIPVEQYFKDRIGDKVLPCGIGTLPFYTFYPHADDVFAPHFCRNAQNLNSKEFQESKDVKDLRDQHEAAFIKLVKSHYNLEAEFPGYLSLLESISSAVHQRKETSLDTAEQALIKTFRDALYYPWRAISEEANLYRLSGVLDSVRDNVNESLLEIVKDPASKKNQRAVFVFTKDIMLASLMKLYNKKENSPIGPATIISLEVYGPETAPKMENFRVKIKRNDDPPMVEYETFQQFWDEVGKFIKEDYKDWCKKSS